MTKPISRYLNNKTWDRYKRIITEFIDFDAGRQDIIWAKKVNQFLDHAEDSLPSYYEIHIEALVIITLLGIGQSIRQLYLGNWMMKTFRY